MSEVEFNQLQIVWNPILPIWVIGLILGTFLGSFYLSWVTLQRLGSRSTSRGLFILRILALLSVWLLLLQPSLEIRRARELPSVLAVAVDQSASMALKSGDRARIDWVRESLQRGMGSLAAGLPKEVQVEFFVFGDQMRPAAMDHWISERKPQYFLQTDFQKVFESLRENFRHRQQKLAGLLLFSDGADRGTLRARYSLDQDLSMIDALDVPIHVFQPGKEADFRDLRIRHVRHDEFGFVKTPLVLEAEVVMEGYDKRSIPVTLMEGREVIRTTSIEIDGNGEPQIVKFQFSPQSLGTHIYTLEVPKYSDEVVVENNRRNIVVRVIRDKIRVLHVAGRPSWDEKFLRITLKRDPNIDLIAFYILRTKDDLLQEADQDELSLIPFPVQKLFGAELETFDLLIFQDFDARKFDFTERDLANISQYVAKGGGFLMVGGGNSFSGGGYFGSPLADILPASLESSAHDFVQEIVEVELTEAGIRHPITRLHPDARLNRQMWQAMPPCSTLNRLRPGVSGSITLASIRLDQNDGPMPLIAVREVGKGRTMVLATDSSWQWNFYRVRDGGTSEAYTTFFNNSIRWLVGDPTESLVDVELNRSQVEEGDPVSVIVRARDRTYKANAHAPLRLTVLNLPHEQIVWERKVQTDGLGRYEGPLDLKQSGHYRIRAQVTLPEGGEVTQETVMVVEGNQGEWLEPKLDARFLRAMAEKTKGQYRILPDDLALKINPKREFQIMDRHVVPLWNSVWALLAASFLLTCEWWIRRRKGLS